MDNTIYQKNNISDHFPVHVELNYKDNRAPAPVPALALVPAPVPAPVPTLVDKIGALLDQYFKNH